MNKRVRAKLAKLVDAGYEDATSKSLTLARISELLHWQKEPTFSVTLDDGMYDRVWAPRGITWAMDLIQRGQFDINILDGEEGEEAAREMALDMVEYFLKISGETKLQKFKLPMATVVLFMQKLAEHGRLPQDIDWRPTETLPEDFYASNPNHAVKPEKALDLTGDRPLTLREARKLKRWWQGALWSVDLLKVAPNKFRVIASRVTPKDFYAF